MRVFAQCAAVGCLAAIVSVSGIVTAQSKDPAAILAQARQALGGEKKLTAVKSFTATGRTRQVRGDNLVPIEFEISVELPDKYLRKDEIPAQESGPTASGFNGDEWLQDPPPPAPPAPPAGAGRGPAAPVEQRLYFADYRDVDGMQFPFRLRRAVGADTVEETIFDRYKINAKIDPKKFDVRKPQ